MLLYFSKASFLVGLGIALVTIPSDATPVNKYCTPSNDVRFFLYNDPWSPNSSKELFCDNDRNPQDIGLNPAWRTKILIHGFQNNWESTFPQNVKDASLKYVGDKFNIIIVDWGRLAEHRHGTLLWRSYKEAVGHVPDVGARVGALIQFLMKNRYTTADKVHLIAFSLGAHVASNAGGYVQQTTGQKIARITGLDPARPGFTRVIAESRGRRRLTRDDAKFVDIIHTNAGGLGYTFSLGHVDFYPNGGSVQPICRTVSNLLLANISVCSHNMAPRYFAETIAHKISVNACKALSYTAYEHNLRRSCINSFGAHVRADIPGGRYYLKFNPQPSPPGDFEELPEDFEIGGDNDKEEEEEEDKDE